MNFIRIIQRIMISVLVGALIVVCICSCGKNTSDYMDVPSESQTLTEWTQLESETEEETESQEEKLLYIYVCGAVKCPGVYTLPQGSRICDAFAAAGGFTEEAATDYWNQAKPLTDGDMIYVPTVEEASQRDFSFQDEDADDGKVNINTATKEELMTLPGIGEAKAHAIIAYRESSGPFSNIDDIQKVEGIKAGVYEKIKDYIVVN